MLTASPADEPGSGSDGSPDAGGPASAAIAAAAAEGERWPGLSASGTGTVAAGRAVFPRVIRLGDPTLPQELVHALAAELVQRQAAAEIPAGSLTHVDDTIVLPGVGEVTADRVCLTADGAYRTTLEAFDQTICDDGEWDHSDSGRPVFRCRRSHAEHVEPRVVEAPATFIVHRCVKWDPSKDPYRPPCVEYGDVVETQLTRYNLVTFNKYDPRHEQPIRSRKAIPSCPSDG